MYKFLTEWHTEWRMGTERQKERKMVWKTEEGVGEAERTREHGAMAEDGVREHGAMAEDGVRGTERKMVRKRSVP